MGLGRGCGGATAPAEGTRARIEKLTLAIVSALTAVNSVLFEIFHLKFYATNETDAACGILSGVLL